MLLKDKIVVVSGIGPGLGVKLAIEAAREGAAGVVAAARSAEKLADAEARVKAVNPNCKVLKVVTDITKVADCERLAAQAVQAFGRVDALVNSAFVHGDMDYASTANLETWKEVINTNLIGTLQITQALVPQMKAQKSGAIVMINTMAVRQIPPLGEAGYAASKAALANSSKWLAKELGPSGIRVNTIHMGWMWGAPVQGYMEWQASEHKIPLETLKGQVEANIPLGRMPTDDECARAALFLVSDYASAVTGAALDANGGMYMP
ncbi:MAG: SDR family oxidoreductase [Nevskiaceae bacterium]|nr:MAG: SDR family oxidoreductase [Nevskiaceae bacterium]TAM33365.1 MAG: SDR family oxidoreductase [Nevskiaceae bacterium]